MDLLKDMIEAYALRNQHVQYAARRAHIIVKEKVETNIFMEFLKMDFKDINFSDKGKMGYGMKYKIEDDKLLFYGVPKGRFEGKTMIVQITSKKNRILKELWFYGVSKDICSSNDKEKIQEISEKIENEARGKQYEIY